MIHATKSKETRLDDYLMWKLHIEYCCTVIAGGITVVYFLLVLAAVIVAFSFLQHTCSSVSD